MSWGIDHIIVDEQHTSFKNLETPTKMERVAGIQTGGSERAFDLYMKCRYLHEKHPGRGIAFATGTPISNTMVEMYTEQRFLDPDGLRERGIEHFDAWAAQFGEVVEAMEISPDGKTLKPAQPVCEVREFAGTATDVPFVRRRADRRHAQSAAPALGRRQAACGGLSDVRRAAQHSTEAGRALRAPALAEDRPA